MTKPATWRQDDNGESGWRWKKYVAHKLETKDVFVYLLNSTRIIFYLAAEDFSTLQ